MTDEEFVYEIAPELQEIHRRLVEIRENYGVQEFSREELRRIIIDVLT